MIFLMRFAETFAILKETALAFPDVIRDTMNFVAIVNINLEVFAIDCNFGASTNQSAMVVALLIPLFALALPLLSTALIIFVRRNIRAAFKSKVEQNIVRAEVELLFAHLRNRMRPKREH